KEPAEQFPDQNRFYEVVDNPNADEQRPEKGNLLASKSSLSAAPDVTNPDKALAPKDEDNITKKKDLPQKEQTSSQKQPEEVMDLEGNVPVFALKNQRQFSKNALTEDNPSQQQESEQQKQTSNDPLTQKEFDAELIGNVRFSTYAWDWAPWWLAFENKIMQYWFAPTAWQMGLIEGYTYVKIRVNREGELMDYEILKHQGHPSLRESSTNALESVFPFKALPPDFPEDHLEIKFVMVYPNLKELYRKNR
nr:hypothetical protein [Calditrichia bacterium]